MCHEVMHYIIILMGKYLQMMVAFHIHKKDPDSVAQDFTLFNTNFEKLLVTFKCVTGEDFIPGDIPNVDLNSDKDDKSEQIGGVSQEIELFLEKIGLICLRDIFEQEELTIEDLLKMNKTDLKDIGINQLKQRKTIL